MGAFLPPEICCRLSSEPFQRGGSNGLCCMEGLVRMWVSLLERAPRSLEGFSDSPESQPLMFAVSLRTYHLWFLFRLRSFTGGCFVLLWYLSLCPPGIGPKFQGKEASWGMR